MSRGLLICTDLDRTLIPNGPQAESPGCRRHFAALVARPEVTLAYVSGRHRELVEEAISQFGLPMPDYVLGDVGTTIYRVGSDRQWQRLTNWDQEFAQDWNQLAHAEVAALLRDLPDLVLQEAAKQSRYKLSHYFTLDCDRDALSPAIVRRLDDSGVKARLIWSEDELEARGLLDVLPASASKLHAVEALMKLEGFGPEETVYCGDSGNDLEVLASAIPAVLVANSQPHVRELALRLADEAGQGDRLYIAVGNFMGMNGHYSCGMLEGDRKSVV